MTLVIELTEEECVTVELSNRNLDELGVLLKSTR